MKTSGMGGGKVFALGILIVTLALFCPYVARSSGHPLQKTGWMAIVDKDGSAEIDGRGYHLDPSASIQDAEGRYVRASELVLPAFIHFQFVYTTSGPIIIRIKVDPDARL